MAKLDIRMFGDPVLRQRALEVDDFGDRLATLAADMLETMREAVGVGLAGPQVGVLKRLFTWEVERDEDEATGESGDTGPSVIGGAVVNPRLIEASTETAADDEGCLSFPGLFYPVDRPLRVEVAHQDLTGEAHVARLEGFLARVWLHEMDHLDGILFIDHLAKHDRREAMKRMRELRAERGLDELAKPEPGSLLLGRAGRRL